VRSKGGRLHFDFSPELLSFLQCSSASALRPPQHPGTCDKPDWHRRKATVDEASAAHSEQPGTALTDLYLPGPDTPRKQGIAHLRALCIAADPSKRGCVKRLLMERWINRECRSLTSQLSAATVLDLLQASTYGVPHWAMHAGHGGACWPWS
jgi:hypothetical protein